MVNNIFDKLFKDEILWGLHTTYNCDMAYSAELLLKQYKETAIGNAANKDGFAVFYNKACGLKSTSKEADARWFKDKFFFPLKNSNKQTFHAKISLIKYKDNEGNTGYRIAVYSKNHSFGYKSAEVGEVFELKTRGVNTSINMLGSYLDTIYDGASEEGKTWLFSKGITQGGDDYKNLCNSILVDTNNSPIDLYFGGCLKQNQSLGQCIDMSNVSYKDNLMNSKDAEMLEDKYASATADDFFVGFIKPTSQKITILDVLPEGAAVLVEHPTISTNSSSITWIKNVNVCDDCTTITINNASSQYLDDYNITTSELVLKNISVNSIKPLMALLSYEQKDQFTYVFIQNPSDAENAYSLISVSNEGDTDTVCRYDSLFGYNENTIYLSNGSDIILVDRQSGNASKMDKLNDDANQLAYVDTARNEFFYYEDNDAKYPGQSALFGISSSARDEATKVEKERISCPDVVSTPANPLIFDGYKYIWRLNTLWKGYKVFRKDGSLREQFVLKQDKETQESPIVFSSPTVIFVEWDGGLAYSTNKGLCLMSELDDAKKEKIFYPEPEDR